MFGATTICGGGSGADGGGAATPKDDAMREENTQLTVDYCLKHPKWRLRLQTHKFVGLP